MNNQFAKIQHLARRKGLYLESSEEWSNHPWVIQYENPYVLVSESKKTLLTTFRDLDTAEYFLDFLHDKETDDLR